MALENVLGMVNDIWPSDESICLSLWQYFS